MVVINTEALGHVLFGIVEIGLAVVLFTYGTSNRANRAYALAACLLGFMTITQNMPSLVNDVGVADYFRRVSGYFHMATPAAFLYFALTYPRPRFAFLQGAGGPIFLAAGIAVPVAAYTYHHGWFLDGTDQPLYIFRQYGFKIVLGVSALLFVHGAGRTPSMRLKQGMTLIGTGLAAFVLFGGSSRIIAAHVTGHPWDLGVDGPFDDYIVVTLGLASSLLLIEQFRRSTSLSERRFIRRSLELIVLGAVTGIAIGWAFAQSRTDVMYGLLNSFWVLLHPAMITYCILRHQLFDIDIRFKTAVDRSTLSAIYLVVFVTVSRAAERLMEPSLPGHPWIFGALAAGVLLLAFDSLHEFTQRVADRALPGVKRIPTMSPAERADFYLAQLQLAFADGRVTQDERRMLDLARRRLAIDRSTAERLEGQVAVG